MWQVRLHYAGQRRGLEGSKSLLNCMAVDVPDARGLRGLWVRDPAGGHPSGLPGGGG